MAEETNIVCGKSADSVKNNNNNNNNNSDSVQNKNHKTQQNGGGCGGDVTKTTTTTTKTVLSKSRRQNGDDDIDRNDYDNRDKDNYQKNKQNCRTKSNDEYESGDKICGTPVLCHCNNRDGCVTLSDILESFNAPISEEQAWALIYQTIRMYRDAFKRPDFRKEYFKVPVTVQNLNVHKDGNVHINCKNIQDRNSCTVTSQKKILMKLAIVVYKALDYNLPEDEECILSEEFVQLISHMTAEDADDEGIENDSEDIDEDNEKCADTKELDYILELCTPRVQPSSPEDHYKAVCRALVTESLELRIFLQKVFDGDAESLRLKADAQTSRQELEKLAFSDWARFWMQVLDELRRGVRLKKRSCSRTPVEYELTPYEILMEDIRARKYNLRKVMVNGDIPPRVKKDAHAVILEFIRSRPPLKKASERKLPPPIKLTPSPREQLMDSIRKGRALRPTQPCLKNRLLPPSQVENFKKEEITTQNQSPKSKQRLIKVDFSLFQDDDLWDLPPSGSSSISSTQRGSTTQMPSYPTTGYNNENNPNNINTVRRRTTYDLATQCESRRASMRRHTIVGCQSNLSGTHSTPPSRPDSRQSEVSNLGTNTHHPHHHHHHHKQQKPVNTHQSSSESQQSQSQLNNSFGVNNSSNCNNSNNLSTMEQFTKNSLDEKQWTERISDRLSLTLEEIVHIRSVMTKAELEGLPVGIRVKEDVEKRKVCFLCLRTRFSIFGPWGIQCKLCQRTVCSKCYTKMRIPTEHFRNVPVVLLSPSLMNSPVGSNAPSPSHHAHVTTSSSSAGPSSLIDESFPKSLMERLLRPESDRKIRNTVGSAPSSPKHLRSTTSTPSSAVQNEDIQQQTTSKQHNMTKSFLATSDTSTISNGVLGANNSNKENNGTSFINGTSSSTTAINRNITCMSRSMEGPKSLPVQSPARPHSNNSTLDRKNRFTRAFTLSSSADQKENTLRGELMAVCNDCRGLVLEIIRASRQTRSSARNRALKNLTLDLSPVYKRCNKADRKNIITKY